jgi:hypothetical protein
MLGADVSAREVSLYHPNRERAESKATRAVVIALLLISAALMTIVLVGGWTKLAGNKPMLIAYVVAYLGMAVYVVRWNRGVLPVACSLAIILLLLALIAGPSWFARSGYGFAKPLLDATLLGLVVYLLIPVQVLLIGFAARGFKQEWHVEIEHETLPPTDYAPAAV